VEGVNLKYAQKRQKTLFMEEIGVLLPRGVAFDLSFD
jgi:hypothetical protein